MNSQERLFNITKESAPLSPAQQEKIREIENKFGKSLPEILQDREAVLKRIASMVGSDFKMTVTFGQVGGGSFFVPESLSITLDPSILLEAEGTDEFIAAHEGAHRAITRTLEQVALNPKQEAFTYTKQIGWSSVHNMLEDPAVNDWVRNLYPRIGGIIDSTYDAQFERDDAIMSSPEIQQLIATLGYVPHFIRFGTETMRQWHKKKYAQDLPALVQDALEKTERAVTTFHKEIPYTNPTEREVLQKAKIRWQVYEKGVWPLVQKLIEDDKLDEKLKQYLKDELQKVLESEERGNKEGAGSPQQGRGQSLEELMEQFGFDEKEKAEMREKVQEALKRKKEAMKAAEDKLQNGAMTQEEHDKAMKKVLGSMPLDMKSMSDSTKKKIGDALGKESKDRQGEIEAQAHESLGKAEDAVNESLQAKIGPREASHAEQKRNETSASQSAQQMAEAIAREVEKKKAEEDAYTAWRQQEDAKRNDWEKAVSARGPLIDELHQRIEEFFQKRRHPKWQQGYSAGQRLNLRSAMQFEADPRNYTRLWERKTVPEKHDYAFEILNDQSQSMREGTKAENDLTAKAMVVEVLTAIGIKNEVLGFTTPNQKGVDKYKKCVEVYKSFEEDLNDMREVLAPRLSQIIHEGGGFTPTYTATEFASERLASQGEPSRHQAHFLIVITDGEPYRDPTDSSIEGLRALNARLSAERGQVIIGMGIGDGIQEDNLKLAYGEGRYVYARTPEEFPDKMAALLEAIFSQTQGVQ